MGAAMVMFWSYIAQFYFFAASTGVDDEDNLRIKDSKAGNIWERNFWSLTWYIHGQHGTALMRELKFFTHHPDD
eukprot:CAMPEP_0202955708 /NCGR_PEP_ID=MMETSP1396-20130829/239_1 /ASSEMBLY_ACC=CAM_ASM_000872 /TAXON_ID= /ORGANISM="Pseudokeronopsis sp., Strain Brazil" /LENGTH=73 /DNA_ID=CAMNT_0049672379 /DNA_START=326 /DNA_END=544 /DNA_ORIENTATION=+